MSSKMDKRTFFIPLHTETWGFSSEKLLAKQKEELLRTLHAVTDNASVQELRELRKMLMKETEYESRKALIVVNTLLKYKDVE